MSGICGYFDLDSKPVAKAGLRAMTAMLEHRGPERTGHWLRGQLGLGHTLLATTPELLSEPQPLEHKETGCVITADVRLDNRDELLELLALRDESPGDAGLILAAYLEWGEECLDRLLGDFAFSLWDPRKSVLFCARDHFGMRPLYYHHAPRQRFMFASDARAIVVSRDVPYRLNEGRIADFLVQQLEWVDYTSTFYEGIFRLPPAHKVIITPGGITVSEYWTPRPGPDPGPMSDNDYRQGFLEVFTQAVDARLRAPVGTVGSMLSGGVDSGSVVSVASDNLCMRGEGPLPTYSAARHREADCAESRAVHAAIEMPGIAPNLIHPDDLDTMAEVLIAGNEEPFDGQLLILKAIYARTNHEGQCVVLDGAGGDVVLGEGSYITRLIRKGRLVTALGEIRGEARFWGEDAFALELLRYSVRALLPQPLQAGIRRLRRGGRIEQYLDDSLISPDFARSIDIEERCEQLWRLTTREWTPDYAVERCSSIRPNMAAGRERYARLAASNCVEARDPFLDKRVVDYCTRLPGHLLLNHGWPKMLLRELMAARLPDEVLWCRAKPHLGWLYNETATRFMVDRDHYDLGTLQQALAEFVDKAALARAWRGFVNGGDAELIHSALILAVWLQENVRRPVVRE